MYMYECIKILTGDLACAHDTGIVDDLGSKKSSLECLLAWISCKIQTFMNFFYFFS